MTHVEFHVVSGSEIGSRNHPDDLVEVDRKVVLIVEDEPTIREVMRFVLECEGFAVETAANGGEALEWLRGGMRPSLVLLDLMMPVMSGREFLDQVVKLPSLEPPPIVVLTAGGSTAVPGAVEVLPKPYDLGLLLEAVERHTGARGARTRAR